MTERTREMSDDQLGSALASLDVAWPSTPDVTSAVMTRIAAPHPGRVVRLPLSRRSRVLLIAAATTLLLAGAAVAAKLVIDIGAVVVRVPEHGGTLPSSTAVPLGEPIGLEEANDLLGAEVAVPAALGAPARVWADEVVTDAGTVVRITLAWDPSAELPAVPGSGYGAVLMRFEGDADVAAKDVYANTGTVSPARVGDTDGVWITGPHQLQLLTGDGIRSVRVDGNVLLWRDGPYTLRLETSLRRSEAIRIAESIPGNS